MIFNYLKNEIFITILFFKMLFQIYIINITTLVLSFFTIGGLSIWKLEDDIYIYLYPHSYNFLWTLVIFNIFFSISVIGMTIHNKSRTYIELKLYELENEHVMLEAVTNDEIYSVFDP